MNEQEDKALIALCKKGDKDAFEELVNKHYKTMFKMAYKWCGNERDAEDITQEACIKLARGIDQFKGNSAFTSWLYRLVINTAKDWYKKSNRHKSTENIEDASVDNKSDDALYAKQVLEAVYELPDSEKEALLLVHSEGLTHKEAAKILNCKESTISWRIHEARKKLGAQFERNAQYG